MNFVGVGQEDECVVSRQRVKEGGLDVGFAIKDRGPRVTKVFITYRRLKVAAEVNVKIAAQNLPGFVKPVELRFLESMLNLFFGKG